MNETISDPQAANETALNPGQVFDTLDRYHAMFAEGQVPNYEDLARANEALALVDTLEAHTDETTGRTTYWDADGSMSAEDIEIVRAGADPNKRELGPARFDAYDRAAGITSLDDIQPDDYEYLKEFIDSHYENPKSVPINQAVEEYSQYAKDSTKLSEYISDPEYAAQKYGEPAPAPEVVATVNAAANATAEAAAARAAAESEKIDEVLGGPVRPANPDHRQGDTGVLPVVKKLKKRGGNRGASSQAETQGPGTGTERPKATSKRSRRGNSTPEENESTNDELALFPEVTPDTADSSAQQNSSAAGPEEDESGSKPVVIGSGQMTLDEIKNNTSPAPAPRPRTHRKATSDGRTGVDPDSARIVLKTPDASTPVPDPDTAPAPDDDNRPYDPTDYRLQGREVLQQRMELRKRALHRSRTMEDTPIATARRKTREDFFDEDPHNQTIITAEGVNLVPKDSVEEFMNPPKSKREWLHNRFGKLRDAYYAAGARILSFGAINPSKRQEEVQKRKIRMAAMVGVAAVANLGWNLYKAKQGMMAGGGDLLSSVGFPSAAPEQAGPIMPEGVGVLEVSGDTIYEDAQRIVEANGLDGSNAAVVDAVSDNIVEHNNMSDYDTRHMAVGQGYDINESAVQDILEAHGAPEAAPAETAAPAPSASQEQNTAAAADLAALNPEQQAVALAAAQEEAQRNLEVTAYSSGAAMLGALAVIDQVKRQRERGGTMSREERRAALIAERDRIEEMLAALEEDDEDEEDKPAIKKAGKKKSKHAA